MKSWISLFFLFFVQFAFGQNNSTQEQKRLEEEFRAAEQSKTKREEILLNVHAAEEIPIHVLAEKLKEKEEATSNQFYEAQLDSIIQKLQILESLEEHIHIQKVNYSNVAILGNSGLDVNALGFNETVLTTLLEKIKVQNPKAVFFIGNLIYPLKENGRGKLEYSEKVDIFGKLVSEDIGFFDLTTFENRLKIFANAVKKSLGDIPFYPLPTHNEELNTNALEVFKKVFHLENATVSGKEFFYSVPLENSLFLVISTDQLSDRTFEWLENTLRMEGSEFPFKFVLGYNAAFSTTAPFGIYGGLEKDLGKRNRLWNILRQNQVTAFFSSDEVLYDRSFRFGVWQIISGGAGALSNYAVLDDTFHHYLLLRIPQNSPNPSVLQVFDLNGNMRDDVTFTQKSGALFQFRISKK